jgi:hypothetical protein
MKEIRFHPQFKTLLVSTAADSINVFRPNFEPDEQEETAEPEEQKSETAETKEDIKMDNNDVWVDSESDEEVEERRIMRAAR